MLSVRDLCRVFWDLESRFGLLDMGIGKVKLWQYLRMELFFRLAKDMGILDRPHQAPLSHTAKLWALPGYVRAAVARNPMQGAHQVDAVILEHDRPREVAGRTIDIYTHYLQDNLRKAGQRLEILERPYQGQHSKTSTSDRKYLDYFAIKAAWHKLRHPVRFSADEIAAISEIESAIASTVGHQPQLVEQFRTGLSRFRAYYPLWRAYLEKRRPQTLYLTVSYGQGEVVKAARDAGIRTIELQHGAFSQYHLGYSYPDRVEPLDYFPDRFHVWSEHWRNAASLPLSPEAIVNSGFDHLQHQRTVYGDTKRIPNQIVVLSQGTIGDRMAEQLWEKRDALAGYQLIFKLHPGQYGRWHEQPGMRKLSALRNVMIVEDTDLYHLLAQSEYQIGVYSTALYEGIEFGCKSVLMDLPGIEYTHHLLDQPSVYSFEEFCSGVISPEPELIA